jgi:hypothetical protein
LRTDQGFVHSNIAMDIPVGVAAAARKGPRNQSLPAEHFSREARRKLFWAGAAVAFGLVSIVGAEMLIQVTQTQRPNSIYLGRQIAGARQRGETAIAALKD